MKGGTCRSMLVQRELYWRREMMQVSFHPPTSWARSVQPSPMNGPSPSYLSQKPSIYTNSQRRAVNVFIRIYYSNIRTELVELPVSPCACAYLSATVGLLETRESSAVATMSKA